MHRGGPPAGPVRPGRTTTVDFTQPSPSTLSVSARIMVILPVANAEVTLNGAAIATTGTTLYYDTQPLRYGSTSTYTLAVTWIDSSGPQMVEQRVSVTAGRITRVDLSPPTSITEYGPVPGSGGKLPHRLDRIDVHVGGSKQRRNLVGSLRILP